MDQDLTDLLKQWLDDDLAAKKRFDEPIITFKGKRVGSLKSAWNPAKKRAGITKRLRMYDFRHSFATKLLDNGADLKHVSSLLGHRSIQQTVDTYQHLSKRLSEDAIQRLPSVLNKKAM